jgi:hypothetical protein
MQINLVYDRSVNNAPPEFITALNAAAEYLDGMILNPITVNVEVGYGEDAGQPLNADELGEGGPRFTTLAYSQITPDLTVGNLPAGDPTLGAGVDVSFAEEQAWGIAPANTGQIDGSVGFSSAGPFDYSTTGAVPAHEYDFMGIAEHELTHALGRYSLLYSNLGNPSTGYPMTVLDLYQYASPGALQYFAGQPTYFSTNDGVTNLGNFDTTSDEADWVQGNPPDSFNAYSAPGVINPVSTTDMTELSALGFDIGSIATTPASGLGPSIWLQNSGGPLAVWQMQGTSVIGGGLVGGNPGPAWHSLGKGDFFGDGDIDVVWQNDDGLVAIWNTSALAVIGGGLVSSNPGPSWHIAGTDDDSFGDNHADIVLQNNDGSVALWDMSGTNIIAGGLASNDPGPNWHVEGTGDFYDDGGTDILLQNDDGSVALWDMSATNIVAGGLVSNDPGASWHIKGTGDFFGDGHTDIVLQNDDGSVALWDMSAINIIAGGLASSDPGPSWHIKGTGGDFFGDGHTGIVLQNDDGSVALWDMSGTHVVAGGLVENPGAAWNAFDDNMRFVYSTPADEDLSASPVMPEEFVFTSFASGTHSITGFNPAQDTIEFSETQFPSYANVEAATSAVAGGTTINLGNGSSLLLPGVNAVSLHASTFALA